MKYKFTPDETLAKYTDKQVEAEVTANNVNLPYSQGLSLWPQRLPKRPLRTQESLQTICVTLLTRLVLQREQYVHQRYLTLLDTR